MFSRNSSKIIKDICNRKENRKSFIQKCTSDIKRHEDAVIGLKQDIRDAENELKKLNELASDKE